jgi:hypothetical protein
MKKIIGAGSASAHYHVHVRQNLRQDQSVSAGLANEFTLNIPLYTQNMEVLLNGTFGSGSASTTIAIDKAASANGAFVNIASISVPMMTAIPVWVDDVLRFRQVWSSAAAAITNASVDVWIA